LGNKQVGFVSRHITKIFIAAIVLVALAIFVSGIGLMFFSDYMVFELDYNDSQREVANSTSKALSLLGFVLLILSTGLLLLSSRVAHLIAGFVKRHGQMRR